MIEFKNPTKADIFIGLLLRHLLRQKVVIWHAAEDRKFMRNNWLCKFLKRFSNYAD